MEIDGKSNPFSTFYAQLLHQGNMLADDVRTSTYQEAILKNSETDFLDKVVLDVGTGTGILAFFALQAGARKVYAVEASASSETAATLAEANGYGDRMIIIHGKVEDIDIPEKVDIIISEPIGFLLVHERMLESYVTARERFLKPDGVMFPSTGAIVLAPYTDDSLYNEQLGKIDFWDTTDFYGIDMSCLLQKAKKEYFSQAVVGTFPPSALLSPHRTVHEVDFGFVSNTELQQFAIPFSFYIDKTAIMHGIGGWFDLSFNGGTETVVLSTAPECPTTHWYQCRLMFDSPLAVNKGQTVVGSLTFEANNQFSYNVKMFAMIDGTSVQTENVVHLHDQLYHYLNNNGHI
jgi:histone-arginine methyltransferase CARM1